MNHLDKIVEHFIRVNKKLKRWKRGVSALAAIVVFVTTYALILPAVTLDVNTASTQAGIDIAESEPVVTESAEEVGPEEPQAEEPEEVQEEQEQNEDPAEASDDEESNTEDASNNDDAEPAAENDQDNSDETDDNHDADTSEESSEAVSTTENSESAATAKTEETVQLITGHRQLVYTYVDETYEEDKNSDRDDDQKDTHDDGYTVYADFGTSAKLPEGVELQVTEITKESNPDAYEEYYEKALSEMQDKYDENTGLSFAKFYDIAFIYDGKEIEPQGMVKVRIEYNEAVEVRKDINVDTVHFDKNNEEKPEVIDSQIDAKKQGEDEAMKSVKFESDQFSVYGVVGAGSLTTSFQSTDGNTYEVTVYCDEAAGIPLDAELKVREIEESADEYEDYMADAEEVMGVSAGKIAYSKLLDITIEKDGVKIEPEEPVRVEIKLLDKDENTEGKSLNVVHFEGEDEEAKLVEEPQEQDDAVVFETNGFSVYGVFYTVDFEYEVDGKVYQFSLPGGGFVSFTDLVEVLGIINDTNSEENGDENGAVITENGEENGINEGAEEDGIDSDTNTALTLGDVEVSEATRKFVANVANVEFSSPELVDVSKVENETTVGQIKESRGLEVEYSAELTEEQIAEINAQTVEAGDWALISLQPFESEESLTVTMKDGEVFTIKVTDGQMHTYVISDSGDTYEVIVTYDDTAEIPEDAELRVREIKDTEEKYTRNIEASNRELQSQGEPELVHPVQFDIAIVSGGEEVEPKEGSIVNVEIRLAKSLLEEDVSAEEDSAAEEEMGMILFNGQEIALDSAALTECRITHIVEDGTAEIIDDVESSVTDDKVVMQFETESFSDYLFDGNEGNKLNNLPSTIYVGDEIYMWNQADYWVTNIGSVVSETKHNNGWDPDGGGQARPDDDNFKTVTAISTGTFRIYNRYNHEQYKEIRVLPARTGTTPPATIDTIDNASIGLTLNLFDYDLDNYLDDYFNGSSHYDNTCISDFAGHGINSGNALKFWGSGIGNNYGSLNQYVEHGVTSIVSTNLNSAGYPVLSNSSGGSGNSDLSYLFTPSDGTDKKAYTNVNGLFKKDGDYYVYDSNQNYAWYNPDTNSFEVYNGTYKQKVRGDGGEQASQLSDKNIGFFPFHKWDNQYDLYVNWNKNLNHHFGMSMSVDFSLPKDPKAVKDSSGKPIVFEFSGDDDLWVFIDGKLAMDIGGIHQPTSGTINFQTGEVTVNGSTQLTKNQLNSRFPDLYDGKKHTMQVFYIERGGCDSNCEIKFNMTQYGNVEFDKVDEDDQSKLLSGAVFGLYKDDKCTQPLMEELKDGSWRTFIVETDENGHAKLEDVPLGDYYLKEIHAPDGYPIAVGSDTVRVSVYVDASGNVKTSVGGQETDAKITNKKPTNINLGLKKEWQDADGQTVTAPEGVNATFEIKRNRTYETYTERPVQGHGEEASHLVVGWLHNNEPHIYEEFDLVAGSQATVSWSLTDGYEGKIGCILDGQEHTKSSNPNNIYSHGFTMPAAGGTTILYIIDESDHGNAIKNINVAGSQFYGNSGGGFIHEFKTVTEPDPDFTYTGTSVTDNKVTLPINESTWEYMFSELPALGTGMVTVDEKQQKVTYKYSYYIEEVSSTAPEGTVVIYKDLNGNVINSPTDAETHTSGTETVINKVPYGYLQIKKEVTYNGSSENLTADQKSKLAGEYKFKIYKKERCAAEDAVQDPNAAADAADKDLIVTITIGTDGKAVVGPNTPVRLLAGNYWIKEVESSNPAMFPVNNPIAVEVTKNHTSDSPVIKSLTNNYDENNGPDKISIDIEKKFSGLDNAAQVPQNFEVLLQYTASGQTKTVTLKNTELATGENGEKINWSQSADGFTWHWKVTNIPSEAKNFKIKEVNYDKTKGYDWKSATLNGETITSTVNDWHDLTVTAPAAELTDVTNDRRTSDSGQNTVFFLNDDDILLSKLTANQGTLVISKQPLNLAERDAVVKGWPKQGGFKTPPHYFSIAEHPNGFSYGDKTVTFGEKNGRTIVKFTQNASAQEAVFAVNYSSEEARNSANLVNTYEEVPITIDIVKVDKNNVGKKLPGAVFTLRQLADEAPTDNGTFNTLDGTTSPDSQPTDADGKTSFANLTHGYYEITEKKAPEGYILNGDTTFYFKIENGEVKWLEKGTGKPSTWTEKTTSDMVSFEAAKAAGTDPITPATNATFTVKNEPGTALPSTGGAGTGFISFLGTIMIVGASLMLLWRRRTV